MLKGHTKIELTDVNTGKRQVFEDDNLVTKGLEKLLGFHGCFGNNPVLCAVSGSDADSTIRRLTGGLMLFDKKIEEDVNIVRAPADADMVACGCGDAYSGTNTMAGSYNQAESGWTEEGGYKHVWDFSTSQGNGQIACACLTTCAGGKIGEGSWPYDSNYAITKVVSNEENQTMYLNGATNKKLPPVEEMESTDTSMDAKNILYINGERNELLRAKNYNELFPKGVMNNYSYAADLEKFKKSIYFKKSIDIDIFRISMTKFSIWSSARSNNYKRETDLVNTVTVEMPDGLKAILTDALYQIKDKYWYTETFRDDGHIYIIFTTPDYQNAMYIQQNEKIYIWEINPFDFTSQYYEIVNTIEEGIYITGSGNRLPIIGSSYNQMAVADDYLFAIGYKSKKVYRIKKSDSTDIKTVKDPDGTEKTMNKFIYAYSNNGKLTYTGEGNNYYVINVNKGEVRVKNVNITAMGYQTSATVNLAVFCPKNTIFMCRAAGSTYQGKAYYLEELLDPSILVTINNLSSPVLKTASQTMKVTYTLQESKEE